MAVHPDAPGSTHRPDFKAERDGQAFCIEAIAPGAKAAAQRRAVLFDTVNRLGDPNFMLWLEDLVVAPSQPASARLRTGLLRWLATLDPDAIPDLEHAPTHKWEHGARPNDRAIGIYGHGKAGLIDNVSGIVKALSTKHHAYGDLGKPFIIAVGSYIFDTDGWHSSNAMFGRVAVELSESPTGEIFTREMRQPDGYFGVPPTWDNNNVSGVLLVNQLMPYHVQRAEVTLWRHPLPHHPLPDDLGLPWRSVALRDGALAEDLPATKAHEFLGLTDPWPPGEPWPDD